MHLQVTRLVALHEAGDRHQLELRGDLVDQGKRAGQNAAMDDQRARKRPAEVADVRELEPVQRQVEPALVLFARLPREAGYGTGDGRQACVGFAASHRNGVLQHLQGVVEDDLRILHDSVLRLETFYQLIRAIHGRVQFPPDLIQLRIRTAQVVRHPAGSLPRCCKVADQRVVVAQYRTACLKHVALQCGVAHVDRPECLQGALMLIVVGSHAQKEQGREDGEHPRRGGEEERQPAQYRLSRRVRLRSASLTPLRVARNFVIEAMSLWGSRRPSWLAAISATASFSDAARPSWK